MRHITSQYKLQRVRRLEMRIQIGTSEGASLLLADDLLAILGSELGEYLGEVGVRSEDWCSGRDLMNDVNNGCLGCAILFEERGDGFAG